MNARPHPGPLPQERVNPSQLLDDNNEPRDSARSQSNYREATTARATHEWRGASAALTLSLGERAGVRASVSSDLTVAFTPLRDAVPGTPPNRNFP